MDESTLRTLQSAIESLNAATHNLSNAIIAIAVVIVVLIGIMVWIATSMGFLKSSITKLFSITDGRPCAEHKEALTSIKSDISDLKRRTGDLER